MAFAAAVKLPVATVLTYSMASLRANGGIESSAEADAGVADMILLLPGEHQCSELQGIFPAIDERGMVLDRHATGPDRLVVSRSTAAMISRYQ